MGSYLISLALPKREEISGTQDEPHIAIFSASKVLTLFFAS
jgi:hypothetical protein